KYKSFFYLFVSKSTAGTTLSGTYTVGASQNSSDLTVSSFALGGALGANVPQDTSFGNAMAATTMPASGSNIAANKAIALKT
ncbi:MAG: hypothetical protein ACO3GK_05705, partial [Bacteroidia bacterium]